jgi:hypothetical protein
MSSSAPTVSWVDQVLGAGGQSIDEIGLITLSIDLPCRRGPPTLQRLWADALDDQRETEMVENVVARLTALARTGPTTIVTLNGQRSDWPALKLASLRNGVDLGELANVTPSDGREFGQGRLEVLDLAAWLGKPDLVAELGQGQNNPLIDRTDLLIRKSTQLYQLFLRFLFVTGNLSRPIHTKIEKSILIDFKRLGRSA